MIKTFKAYVCTSRSGLMLHREGCEKLPTSNSERAFIGTMYSNAQAVTVSRSKFATVHSCPCCMTDKTPVKFEPVNMPVPLPVMNQADKPSRKKQVKVVQPIRHFPT